MFAITFDFGSIAVASKGERWLPVLDEYLRSAKSGGIVKIS